MQARPNRRRYMRVLFLSLITTCFFLSCNSQTSQLAINTGTTVSERFNTPDGFIRLPENGYSFSTFLSTFPLKKPGTKVLLYNGNEKNRQDVHEAVLDIDVGAKDLQQCADAVMRLRAEYLYKTKQYDKLHFNFTNGFNAEFSKWVKGYRVKIKGNNTTWYLGAKPGDDEKTFRSYLELVFSYAGTLSLSKELKKKSIKNISAGDVFLVGGSPGHAVIVMDVAMNVAGTERVFCIAQSYMPAQNIHVLKNLNSAKISPWYNLKEGQTLETPEWDFPPNSLYTFD
jgi:hypothetical protein